MKHLRKLLVILPLLCLVIGLTGGQAIAGPTVFLWEFDHQDIRTSHGGEMFAQEHGDSTVKIEERMFGQYYRNCFVQDCNGYPVICSGSFCAGGRFWYNKVDTVALTEGDGMNFSPNAQIAEFDPRPINAFAMSSLPFMASTAAILDDPFVRAVFLAIFGIYFATKIISLLQTMLSSSGAWVGGSGAVSNKGGDSGVGNAGSGGKSEVGETASEEGAA